MLERKVLLVDDDESILSARSRDLREQGYEVEVATCLEEAIGLFATEQIRVVVTDLKMPGGSGLDVISRLREIDPQTMVIILTGLRKEQDAVAAVNLHAFAFLRKGHAPEELPAVLAKAFEHIEIKMEVRSELLSFLTHALRSSLAGAPGTTRRIQRACSRLEAANATEKDLRQIQQSTSFLQNLHATMSNTLDTFSLLVHDPAELASRWETEEHGDGTSVDLLSPAIFLVLCRLFHQSWLLRSKMRILGERGEKELGLLDARFSDLEGLVQDEGARHVLSWVENELPCLEIHLEEVALHLRIEGTRFSVLNAIISELLLNAFKYYDGNGILKLALSEKEGEYCFEAINSFDLASTKEKGTRRGLAFIRELIRPLSDLRLEMLENQQVFTARLLFRLPVLNQGEIHEDSVD